MHRGLNKQEQWVQQYESLVSYIENGYEEIIYEYTNDLSCRLFIQQAFEIEDSEILKMQQRIEIADEKLRSILVLCSMCIHGKYPKNYFWFWGVPKNSTELMQEAKLNKWL